tara:strand:- start:203 stop:1267 length:1065 start_codon:yes stop_codon:yes gene_type:complete
MPESSFESAWKALHVEKAVPLAVPIVAGAFGGVGAFRGAGGRFVDPETGELGLNVKGGATFSDPITGGIIAEREIQDPTDAQRLAGAGVGALQMVNPAGYLGLAGRGVRAGQAGRAAAAARAGPSIRYTSGARGAVGRGLSRTGGSKFTRFAGRGAQSVGQYGPVAGAALTHLLNPFDLPPTDSSSFGGQEAGRLGTAGFGQGGTGDLANVNSNATADRVIFDPTLARGNQALTGFEGQQEFGGFGVGPVRTGENMRIGDQLLKEVNTRMHEMHLTKKDVCATCNKKDCLGKMHCMAKAECPKCGKNCKCDQKAKADKSKKPAHGMVIVIGSKAGPGPSKNGKREKLDSEKKED